MKSTISFVALILIFCLAGCGISSQSFDVLINNTNSQIEIAQQAGADQLASAEFEDAKSLLEGAKAAQKNKQKEILAKRAYAKARLAETVARQVKAENEATQLEAELKKIEEDANKIRLERQATDNELKQMLDQDKKN